MLNLKSLTKRLTFAEPLSQNLNLSIDFSINLATVFVASLIIAVSSQLSFVLPFTTVPISFQPHAVLFLAAVLGPQKAFLAVLTFLLEGLSGLPVFALGHLGLPTLMGPTGGYLLSYLPISLAVGCLFRINKPSSYSAVFLNLLVGMFGILILGSLWLSNFVGLNYFIPMGITPFILPGLAKTAVLAFIVQRVKN